jgi:hypothetical protein
MARITLLAPTACLNYLPSAVRVALEKIDSGIHGAS